VGSIWALNPSGSLKWISTVYAKIDSSPALSSDGSTLYFGSYNYKVYAMSTANGKILWEFTTGNMITSSSPAVAGSGSSALIYIGSLDGYLYAITGAGTLAWKYLSAGGISSSPIITSNGNIYFVSSSYVYALSPSGGEIFKQKLTLLGFQLGSLGLSPDEAVLYIGDMDGVLYAVSIQSGGSAIWSFKTKGPIYSPPTVSSDGAVVLVGSSDKSLYAIRASNGELLWEKPTEASIMSSPVVNKNGRVFITSDNGQIIAYDTI